MAKTASDRRVIVTRYPSVMISYSTDRMKKYRSGVEVPIQRHIQAANHLLCVEGNVFRKLNIKVADISQDPNGDYFDGRAFLGAYQKAQVEGVTNAAVTQFIKSMQSIDKKSGDATIHEQSDFEQMDYAISFINRLKSAVEDSEQKPEPKDTSVAA